MDKHDDMTFNESEAIFIDINNYEQKFKEYFETKDDPRWVEMAKAGHKKSINEYTNDIQFKKLSNLIYEII